MDVTPATVREERDWIRGRADVVVPLINRVRADLGEQFDTEVGRVTPDAYRREVDAVFVDGDLAVNVAALVRLLRTLDVTGDYPGFVVDELLGRELAGTIAGDQPLRLLGEATFHFADVSTHEAPPGDVGEEPASATGGDEHQANAAGADDLDAALAAGFQTRLPGWEWRERESPFGVEDAE